MALYYPLSGFLMLFANLLQNPEDPSISSDIDLMNLVLSFLSPGLLSSTPFNANVTLKIFTELVNVARKFVAKVSSQGLKKAKRVHENDEESDGSILSKEPVTRDISHGPAEKIARTDTRVRYTYIRSRRPSDHLKWILHCR